MKQHNQVLSKFGRAGLVALFATGLTFAGIAPANAISGKDFTTGSLGSGGGAIAHISVPEGNGSLKYKSCAGVLIAADEVLTTNDCFSWSEEPYRRVLQRGTETAGALSPKTARITFGNSSQSSKVAQDDVYFSVVSNQIENKSDGGRDTLALTVIKLDRPVTGTTPAGKVSGVAKDEQQVNMVGWETTDLVPNAGSIERTLSASDLQIAYRSKGGSYYTSPFSWKIFNDQGQNILGNDMPGVTDYNGVIPAFKISGLQPAKDHERELGTPVFDSSGALQGLLVGYTEEGEPVFLDLGEPKIANLVYNKRDDAKPQGLAKDADSESALANQLIDLRNFLCSNAHESAQAAEKEDAEKKFEEIEKEHGTAETEYNKAKNEYDTAENTHHSAVETHNKAEAAKKTADSVFSNEEKLWSTAKDKYEENSSEYNNAKSTYDDAVKIHEEAEKIWKAAEAEFQKAENTWADAKAKYAPAKEKWDAVDGLYQAAKTAKDNAGKGASKSPLLSKYDDLAVKNAGGITEAINNYNKSVDGATWKYNITTPAKPHVPVYGVTSPLDPQYFDGVPDEAATWLKYCQSEEGKNKLDLATMYRKAGAVRKDFQKEVDKLGDKLKAAEQAMIEAKQAYEQAGRDAKTALSIASADASNPKLQAAYEKAEAETEKKKDLYNEKSEAYEVQKEINDEVKAFDKIMRDAEMSVGTGLSTVAQMLREAQETWKQEDEQKKNEFLEALQKHLDAKKTAFENEKIKKDNNEHPPTKNSEGKLEAGYPKELLPVDETALATDPQAPYLTANGSNSKVKRNMGAYKDFLNKAVPILLEARYQIWNIERINEKLSKGEGLGAADKLAKKQQILDILDNYKLLQKQIKAANGKMYNSNLELEKIHKDLPEGVKRDLDKKGYGKALKKYENAKTSYNSLSSDLEKLKEVSSKLSKAKTSSQINKHLENATTAYEHMKSILEQINTATAAMDDFRTYIKAIKDGNIPDGKEKPDPTWGMTPDQKKAWDEMQKAKEEAEKKAKELQKAEDDKKKPGNQKTEADKKKAEEEKKKADDEAKKDEARLAKALSKNTLRAEGTDRVLTSIAAWKMGKFPGDSLVLVDGNVHADGLSATPFAAALKAPVLLTCWNTGLEPALMDQIKASGKKKLFLVGGQVPMTPYDEFELRDAGLDIFRIAGPDRYATSVGVNQATEPLIGAKPKKPINLYIGDGVGFPDALVAGAAAGRVGGLMLLSKGKQLDPQTYNYISNLGQTRPLKIIPVGGPATAAVKNTPWPTTMSINIAPIVGKDRYETAAKLATTLPGTRAAVLATGENFADALSGGPLAVDQNATLVLTRSQELPPASYQSLQRFGSEKTIVMGGKAAVSPKVAELINGATLKNTDTKTVLGTLLERKKLRDDKANQEAKERRNALSKVKGMIKDSNSLKDVMSQLGFGSIDDLTKLLNDFKAQQDKDKKPDTAKP